MTVTRQSASANATKRRDAPSMLAPIIEAVDQRAAASDGPVTPTLQEMTQDEISEIYRLAKAGMERKKKRKDRHGV